MKIPLSQLARNTRRKSARLRPIIPTGVLEQDLFAIYADSLRIWATAVSKLADSYTQPGPVTDATPQVEAILNEAIRNADSIIFYQTERLGRWVTRVGNWHGQKTISGVKSALGVDITPYINFNDIAGLLNDSVRANVALIRSVNSDTRSRVEAVVYDAFVNRRTKKEFTDALAKVMGITKKRAWLIASDQLYKLNIALTAYRNQQMGIELYEWEHLDGQKHPRPVHVARDGKLFRWDKPPQDGPPGYAVNCHCAARPYVELG